MRAGPECAQWPGGRQRAWTAQKGWMRRLPDLAKMPIRARTEQIGSLKVPHMVELPFRVPREWVRQFAQVPRTSQG
jgi:hypothetical protein